VLTRFSSGPPRRRRFLVALAVVVSAIVVASLFVAFYVLPGSKSHTTCVGVTRVGNVTAWYPYAFVAAPYGGSEVGDLRIWTDYLVNGVTQNLTESQPTSSEGGNVTLAEASGGNWSIYAAVNRSVAGSGSPYPCSEPLVAILGPPNGPTSDSFGGASVATGLRNDTGLPTQFNASAHCESFGASPSCAISAAFELNFTHQSGRVNTCGETSPTTLDLTGQPLEAGIPFSWKGIAYSVPTAPTPLSGMTGWFNYTFPADFGIWQYQYLPGYAGGNSGLVFSYSACAG